MLVDNMTDAEMLGQFISDHPGPPAIARLGVKAYSYWTEAAHGIVAQPVGPKTTGKPGHPTVLPCPTGMAASFDTELVRAGAGQSLSHLLLVWVLLQRTAVLLPAREQSCFAPRPCALVLLPGTCTV